MSKKNKQKQDNKKKDPRVKEVKAVKESKKRKAYPLKEGTVLKALPADFNFSKFSVIKGKFWETDWMFLLHRAKELDFRADILREKAEEAKAFGSKKDRVKATRLKRMQSKMDELRKELEAEGVDVDGLLEIKSDKKS